ncbi:MAG: NUDIX hydrolase [Nitrospirae bacterium]|nr:NUDIX hydrolase [Nitrospirota bacterium]
MTNLKGPIGIIESVVEDPSLGLPEDVFLFVSRITPLVNVDLLIRNDEGQTLLSWRDDGYWTPGWHVPGGIIRYREKFADRIRAVAKTELGAEVAFEQTPVAINELFHPARKNRGHFISLLYRCSLLTPLDERLRYRSGSPLPGQLMWHDKCPENIIAVHEVYREYI